MILALPALTRSSTATIFMPLANAVPPALGQPRGRAFEQPQIPSLWWVAWRLPHNAYDGFIGLCNRHQTPCHGRTERKPSIHEGAALLQASPARRLSPRRPQGALERGFPQSLSANRGSLAESGRGTSPCESRLFCRASRTIPIAVLWQLDKGMGASLGNSCAMKGGYHYHFGGNMSASLMETSYRSFSMLMTSPVWNR